MLYGCETWSVKLEDVIRLEMNHTRMVRCMCNVKSEDRTSAEEYRTRLNLKSMRVLCCPEALLQSK